MVMRAGNISRVRQCNALPPPTTSSPLFVRLLVVLSEPPPNWNPPLLAITLRPVNALLLPVAPLSSMYVFGSAEDYDLAEGTPITYLSDPASGILHRRSARVSLEVDERVSGR